MADTYTFPDIGEPNLPVSSNCGDSYKVKSQDSTISTTSDANYKHTRPRTTRMIRTWTFAWVGMKQEKYDLLMDFWSKVGTFQSFSWKNWMDGKTYLVRFSGALEWQENYPYGWQGSLSFEEV